MSDREKESEKRKAKKRERACLYMLTAMPVQHPTYSTAIFFYTREFERQRARTSKRVKDSESE